MVVRKKSFKHACNCARIAEFDVLTPKRNTLMATWFRIESPKYIFIHKYSLMTFRCYLRNSLG